MFRARQSDDARMRLAASDDAFAGLAYRALTRERLARVTNEHGCDVATALFYDRVRREPAIAAFMDEVDARQRAGGPIPPLDARVLVAPAAFFRELRRFGGDGAAIRSVAERFGIACELLPSESAGSVARNADLIRAAIEARSDEPLILVSLSKGGADLRLALASLGRAPTNVRAWVQICGLVRGSPLIDAILANPVRRTLLRAYLRYLGADLSVCSELGWRDNPLLGGPFVAPEGVEVVNVVGFPLAQHMRGNARRRHAELQRFGPNDGSTLLADAILEPGLVYPVWGADHYFRVPEAPELLAGLFRYFAARWQP